MKDLGLSIVIGAALAGSFNQVIGQSINQFNKVGETVQELESQTAQIGTFKTLQSQLGQSEQAYNSARESVTQHRRAASQNRNQQAQLGDAIKKQSITVGTAEKELEEATQALNKFTAELPKGKKRSDAMRSALAFLKGELEQKKAAVKTAEAGLKGLNKELKVSQAEEQKLSRKIADGQRAINSKNKALQQSRDALASQRRAMADSGVGTTNLTNKTVKLGAAIKNLKQHQTQLGVVMRQQQQVMSQRDAYKSQMIDAFALGTAILSPVAAAVKFESVMADVNKVVDFTTPLAFKKMGDDLLQMSTVIPMAADGLGDIMAAAGQAGIARDELLLFTGDAAKMGVAFDISGKQAGSAMTGLRSIYGLNQQSVVMLGDAYNHLSNNMDAQASEMLTISNRAGSVSKEFGLSGAQVGALGATFVALKTPTDVAGTAINAMLQKLGTADKQGKKFQSALADIGWSASELKSAIKDDAQGTLLEFFDTVSQSDDVMGNMVDLFGLEYSDDLTKLAGNLDLYRESLGYVANETAYAGSMQKEYEVRSATTANSLTLLKNQVTRLGVTVGSVLLPPLNAVVGVVGSVTDTVTNVATTFPFATKVIIGLAMGLGLMKVAAIAGGYALTFLKGSWLSGVGALRTVQTQIALANVRLQTFTASTTAAGAATKSLGFTTLAGKVATLGTTLKTFALTSAPVVVGAIKSIGIALATTPIGWAALAIGAAAFTIYKYWQPIKAFFGGIWDGLVAGVAPVLDSLAPVGAAIGWVADKVGDLFGWVGDLLSPVQMSSESLEGFASAGEMVGSVFAGLINVITAPFRMAADLIGMAVSGVGKLVSWAGFSGDDDDDPDDSPGKVVRESEKQTKRRNMAGAVLAGAIAASPVVAEPVTPQVQPFTLSQVQDQQAGITYSPGELPETVVPGATQAITPQVQPFALPQVEGQQASITYQPGELPAPVLPGATQAITPQVQPFALPQVQDQQANITYSPGELPETLVPGATQVITSQVQPFTLPQVQDQQASITYQPGELPAPVLTGATQAITPQVQPFTLPQVQDQQAGITYSPGELPETVVPGATQVITPQVQPFTVPQVQDQQAGITYSPGELPSPVVPGITQDVTRRVIEQSGPEQSDIVLEKLQQLQLLQPSAPAPARQASEQAGQAPKVEHTHHHSYEIKIVQEPGESQDALAKRIIREIEEQQKKMARGKLYG